MSKIIKKVNFNMITFGLLVILLSVCGSYWSTSYALTENGYAVDSSNVEYKDNSSLGVTNVQAAIDGTCIKFNEKLDELMTSMYPIGSIYFSATLSTPEEVSKFLGGTWEIYGQGKTLVGVDNDDTDYSLVNKTGGSKSNDYTPSGTVGATTLSISQIPSHTHTISHTHTTPATTIGSSGAHTHSTNATVLTNPLSVSGVTLRWSNIGAIGSSGIISSSGNENINLTIPSLTIPSSGSHTHTVPAMTTNSQNTFSSSSTGGGSSHTHSFTGNSSSISTIQPYITVYMYKRVN